MSCDTGKRWAGGSGRVSTKDAKWRAEAGEERERREGSDNEGKDGLKRCKGKWRYRRKGTRLGENRSLKSLEW